ncbi:MAG: ATP-binding protein, partial [Erysipelotrichaceae bacterium]
NANVLIRSEAKLTKDNRFQLYSDIYDDSMWLINIVENLLSVTKIEDGTMHLKLIPELIDEIIEEAISHINRRSLKHTIKVINNNSIIVCKMDAHLIVQVIINIVDNAIKYTPEGSTILINYEKQGKYVKVSISDNGVGLSKEDKLRIFDMFYTPKNTVIDGRRSLGLGLALCKSIVNAHGGQILVKDNEPKGSIFSFTLPYEEVKNYE